MTTLAKITCSRCGGSGRYSFNLLRGTVCFGCEGKGFVMVNIKKQERKVSAKAKRDAAQANLAERRLTIAAQVKAELQSEMGPFTDDAKGVYEMVCACQREYGKSPGDIVNARLRT